MKVQTAAFRDVVDTVRFFDEPGVDRRRADDRAWTICGDHFAGRLDGAEHHPVHVDGEMPMPVLVGHLE